MNTKKKSSESGVRALPSVDALIRTEAAAGIIKESGRDQATKIARGVIDSLRQQITGGALLDRGELLQKAEELLLADHRKQRAKSLKRVINATGVIIHTNLGRSSLSDAARAALLEASEYCNLEYDLESGSRGRRGARAESLLAELTGAGDALIVNNCAAAAVLVLTSLCKGGEAIISRGELVEIGGDFRVPDVMAQSGAELVEVGTTNRTKLADYEKAIGDNTRLIVKVHPSNYRIVGFTSSPSIRELSELAQQKGILLYEDAGSGALCDLSQFGLDDEPVIARSIDAGADVVTFSGDKLLGGPQAGLIVGGSEVIKRIRANPLFRALRGSKLIYAALEATLEAFARGAMMDEIPTLRMLAAEPKALAERTAEFAEKLLRDLREDSGVSVEVVKGCSVVGGGSAPSVRPESWLISLSHAEFAANELEQRMRESEPPVIARIEDGNLLLDLRTVSKDDEEHLTRLIMSAVRERD